MKIPIALVSKKDGLLLADLARKFPDLEIGVKASLGGVETFNVELDFWLGVFDENSYRFLLDFEQILKRFGGRVSLNVVYKFFDYTALGEGVTSALCYSSGKYCVPEANRTRSQALLDEGIRQICLFDHAKSILKNLDSWFSYIAGYKVCMENFRAKNFQGEFPCGMETLQPKYVAKAAWETVKKCEGLNSPDSSLDKRKAVNHMLDHCGSSMSTQFYNILPSLFVNKQLYKENLELGTVVGAICSKFTNQPDFCKDFFTKNIDWTAKKKNLFEQGKFIGLMLIGGFAAIIGIIWVCMRNSVKRRIKSEIDEFIQNQVNSHMQEGSINPGRNNFAPA